MIRYQRRCAGMASLSSTAMPKRFRRAWVMPLCGSTPLRVSAPSPSEVDVALLLLIVEVTPGQSDARADDGAQASIAGNGTDGRATARPDQAAADSARSRCLAARCQREAGRD